MHDDDLTTREMLEEVLDIVAGLGIALLPLSVFALPGIVLVAFPLALLTLPFALAGGLLAVPYLLVRALRRRA